ncbi:MAG: hypothetical protein V3T77_00430, partial [Planctomycetota bacterium]
IEQHQKDQRVKELRRRMQRNIGLKRWSVAIDEMKELVVLDPYNPEYQLTLGLLFRKVKNLEEARRKYQDFQDLGGHPAIGHLHSAEAWATSGNKQKAFDHLRRAAEHGMNIMKAVLQFESMTAFRSDTEFIKLALKLERYTLDIDGLSDPTTDRFKKEQLVEVPLETPGSDNRRWPREKQEHELRKAKQNLANIERFLIMEKEERAMEAYSKLRDSIENIDRFTVPAFAAEMREIIGKKEIIEARIEEIRLKYYFRKSKNVITDMQRSFQNQDFPKVALIYMDLEKIAEAMTTVNPEFQQVAGKVLEVGQNWVRKAKIREEFLAKSLIIQGIVTQENGASLAIVNRRLLKVGQVYKEMRVHRIEPNQIYFDYKGERIPLVFRRY